MKISIYFVGILFLFLTSCEKDENLVKHEAWQLIQLDLQMQGNQNQSPLICVDYDYGTIVTPSAGVMSGQTSITGSLAKQLSAYQIISCNSNEDPRSIDYGIEGLFMDNQGEFFNYRGILRAHLPTDGPIAVLTGSLEIYQGTGSFKDIKGSIQIRKGDAIINLSSGVANIKAVGSAKGPFLPKR
jgi:hypothetical protein